MPKFKIGDRVIVRNDESDADNQNRLGDFEADLLSELEERSITGTAYEAIWTAIADSKPWKVITVQTESDGSATYECQVAGLRKKVTFPGMFEETDLKPAK